MAQVGDSYIVEIKKPHLEWGSYRHTESRDIIYGEGYIQIPAQVSYSFKLFNSNNPNTGLGYNLFNCTSLDGKFQGILKSAGSQGPEEKRVFAKQFQGNGDLQAIGSWYQACGAEVGDEVKVTWTSPTDIVIEFIKCV